MTTSGAIVCAAVMLTLAALSGWYAREFVYQLEQIRINACDTDGSCGR